MNLAIAALIGFVGGLGLLMVVQGIRGYKVLPSRSDFADGEGVDGAESLVWFLGGCLAAIVVFAATGWIVLTVATLAVVAAFPRLRVGKTSEDAIEKTKAIATWTEMIRDNMAAAAGLEQALVASAEYAPQEIEKEISLFVRSLDHTNLEDALSRLGAALNHPAADMVIVSLTNAARMQASDLGPLLSRLSATTRDDVRIRQRVGIESAKIKTSARIVCAITFGVAVMLWLFNPALVAAYDTFDGQIMLVVILAVFAVGGWSIRRYAKPQEVDRFTARRKAVV